MKLLEFLSKLDNGKIDTSFFENRRVREDFTVKTDTVVYTGHKNIDNRSGAEGEYQEAANYSIEHGYVDFNNIWSNTTTGVIYYTITKEGKIKLRDLIIDSI